LGSNEDKYEAALLAIDLAGIEVPEGISIKVYSEIKGPDEAFYYSSESTVILYAGAFERSVGWLASTIGHEFGHHFNTINNRVFDSRNVFYDGNIEHAIVYDWEVKNAHRTGITAAEVNLLRDRVNSYLGVENIGSRNTNRWNRGEFTNVLSH
jgi:hypothetical protein